MNGPTILLACATVATLALGFEAWRLTSSKAIRLNTFIGGAGLGLAAMSATGPGGGSHAAVIAFFVAMLFGGRAAGIFMRSRRDAALRRPAQLMFGVAGVSLLAAAAVYYWP